MKISFVDLKAQYQTIKPQIDLAIQQVIEETSFIGGSRVKSFEDSFAKAYGVKHCISTANGTDSLYIVLKMLGIGIGDEVITVANSWISSSEVISQTGAKPVFVDIDPVYYTIDENLLESKITVNTKCIIPVHLYGQMCNMDKISEIAKKFNIPILEDCAQSHFSEYKGIRAGLVGLAGSFSFYPGKNLGAYGDAGCLITNDDNLALKCRMFARHGALKKHEHDIEGINSRLDGIQAAILSVKLPHILEWTKQRNRVADLYSKLLSGIDEIAIPKRRPNTLHSFHLYVIRCDNRNELQEFLLKNGVQTAVHYPIALPNMNAYKYLGYSKNDFPVASNYQDRILSLPIYPELSDDQVVYIAELIKKYYEI
ncbi:DegT/DnrJ/EryC1/StrS family aminotransferase [Polaribacter litorisediminis]|uniref:DegT/DnrJ/EryC1/StrS family aminotransferase n=1 Tax=Polaribacter litorisediminis TaxID=1908341 RepID=UPI001CBC2AC4|nr:DegT/DnrJ/EryC1/StrS family aminotransferase [Polaribacter litorisediminis]UAM96594.1 DegT/DnrJ/EryC1/StrS family aminotransferase [Polaribacter litorisediminis]